MSLLRFIETLETHLGKQGVKQLLPMQPGDVRATYAETERLARAVGFAPSTPLEAGLARFAEWFKSYYGYA